MRAPNERPSGVNAAREKHAADSHEWATVGTIRSNPNLSGPSRVDPMITVYSEDHLLRNVRTELHGGLLVPPHECPERVAYVLQRIEQVGLGSVVPPQRFGLGPVLRVHDAAFVSFLTKIGRAHV